MTDDTKTREWPPPMPERPWIGAAMAPSSRMLYDTLTEHWELLRSRREAVCTLMADRHDHWFPATVGGSLHDHWESQRVRSDQAHGPEQAQSNELIPVYIAHRLSGDIQGNLSKAAQWVAWLAERYYIEPVCPWITLASVWTEEHGRALGLEIDRAAVRRCKLFFAVGAEPWLSSGMQEEADTAKEAGVPVRDLMGIRFPPGRVAIEHFDAQMAATGIRKRD